MREREAGGKKGKECAGGRGADSSSTSLEKRKTLERSTEPYLKHQSRDSGASGDYLPARDWGIKDKEE